MKPPAFRYALPTSLEEATSLLAEHGDEAKVLAGGQSLVPLMNLRLARPSVLVDINRIEGLGYVRADNGTLLLGALTRHREVETSALLAEACPLLKVAAGHIGYPAIRNRGTIGGSLAHADPLSELPCAAVALDAEVVAASASGERTIPASELFETQFITTLAPEEVVREVRFPRLPAGARWAFQEFARKDGDFAIAAVAVVLEMDQAGRVERARIGLAGVADRPVRAAGAEAALAGQPPDAGVLDAAAEAATGAVTAEGDVHGSTDYRRQLVRTLTRRALDEAVARTGSDHA